MTRPRGIAPARPVGTALLLDQYQLSACECPHAAHGDP